MFQTTVRRFARERIGPHVREMDDAGVFRKDLLKEMFQLGLIDDRSGVALVLTGGLLPAAIFILKDFMDATPKSYEESARVFGASPLQVLRHVVVPVARPGLATIGVWTARPPRRLSGVRRS